MRVDLRGNIKGVGPVFLTYAKGVQGRALVRRTVAIEDTPPWRRGEGVGVLLFPGVVVTVGTWQPDTDPNLTDVREAMEMAHDIPQWQTLFEITTTPKAEPSPRPFETLDDWTIVPMEERA